MKKILFATLVVIGALVIGMAISGCNKKQAAKAPSVVEIKAAPAKACPVAVITVTPVKEEVKK